MVLAKKKAVGAEYLYTEPYSIPVAKEQRALRKKQKVSLAFRVTAGLFCISFLFMIGLAYTSLKAGNARLNWELNQIKQTNLAISENIEKLKLDIATAKSPEKIEQLATTQLGMIRNPRIEYLVLSGIFGDQQEEPKQNTVVSQPQESERQQTEKNENIFMKMSTFFTQE